jgi:hypothetical protein
MYKGHFVLNFLCLKNNNDSTDQPYLFCQEVLLGTNFMIISYQITFFCHSVSCNLSCIRLGTWLFGLRLVMPVFPLTINKQMCFFYLFLLVDRKNNLALSRKIHRVPLEYPLQLIFLKLRLWLIMFPFL